MPNLRVRRVACRLMARGAWRVVREPQDYSECFVLRREESRGLWRKHVADLPITAFWMSLCGFFWGGGGGRRLKVAEPEA